jgi:chemotaxis protein MotC
MKFALPRRPRFNWKPPKFGLARAMRGAKGLTILAPRGNRLFVGAGVLSLVALGVLGWLTLRPTPRAPQPDSATIAEPAGDDAKPAPQGGAANKVEAREDQPAIQAAEAPDAAGSKVEEAHPDAGAAKAQTEVAAASSEAEELVLRLQNLQERVAAGDPASYAEMPRLIRHIGQRFLAQPREIWSRKSNAQALVLYLLSGGLSDLGRKILGSHAIAPSEERLVKGAVAYLDGVDCAERDGLLELDPRMLPIALGAQVAFVQSILLAGADRQKALAQLDLARLLAPGGLVEEAALRREVGLLSETSDFDKFAALARQYWSRFRQSPYAENFLRQFAGAVARVSVLIKPEQWEQVDEFISSLTAERRRELYLVSAQTAAVAGNSSFADLAAQRALQLAAPGTVERQRALLYRAVSQVAGAETFRGSNLLRDVEREKLPVADQPLYDATALASARIFRAPEGDFAAPPSGAGDLVGGELALAEAGLRAAEAAVESARDSMERKGR